MRSYRVLSIHPVLSYASSPDPSPPVFQQSPQPKSSLLLPHPLQNIWIPSLRHILMAFYPIHQRRLTQVFPPPLRKSELHVIYPLPISLHCSLFS